MISGHTKHQNCRKLDSLFTSELFSLMNQAVRVCCAAALILQNRFYTKLQDVVCEPSEDCGRKCQQLSEASLNALCWFRLIALLFI